MKRGWLISSLLTVVMLALVAGGCRRAAEAPPAPIARAGTELAQGPNQYQFSQETGFSVELGEQPEFEAQVEPYEFAPHLGNVANLEMFAEDLRPEHLDMIAENGFVVVPADWRQMEFIYELNNYERVHKPSFVTTDSILHTFHIFYDYVLRTIEVCTLYDRVCTLALGLLQGAAEQYEAAELPEIQGMGYRPP